MNFYDKKLVIWNVKSEKECRCLHFVIKSLEKLDTLIQDSNIYWIFLICESWLGWDYESMESQECTVADRIHAPE